MIYSSEKWADEGQTRGDFNLHFAQWKKTEAYDTLEFRNHCNSINCQVVTMRPIKGQSQRRLKIMSWHKMQYQILPAIPIKFLTRIWEGCMLAKSCFYITKAMMAKFES